MTAPITLAGDDALARARARAYAVFSRLVLRGLDAAMADLVDEVSVLRSALASGVDAEVLAADHYALFAMDLFPYESVYLDPEGRPGGVVTQAVADAYLQAGFGLTASDVTADHLGVELAFLSFLSSAEADAIRDGHLEAASRARRLASSFLDEHLGAWLAPFAAASADVVPSFWTQIVELIEELVVEHGRELEWAPASEGPSGVAEALLDDADTGLGRIADFLCRPGESGVLLTRGDLERVGRRLGLPTGFGSRAQRMQCLLESAAQYESLPALCEVLSDAVARRAARYRARQGVAWIGRTDATLNLLRRLADAAPSAPTTKESDR